MTRAKPTRVAYLIEPPFNFRDDAGHITGCDVELVRQVFLRLGFEEPVFVETEFADLLPGLEQGAWHMTTGLFATEDRKAKALFSRPIWALPDGLLIRAEDMGRLEGYGSLTKDHALRLATVRDQAQYQSAIEQGVLAAQIFTFDTYGEAAKAVREGRVDAYASVARAHLGYLEQHPNGALAAVAVPTSEKPAAMGCFGIAKTRPDLRYAVDQVLETLIGGTAHRALMRQFRFSDDEVDLVSSLYGSIR